MDNRQKQIVDNFISIFANSYNTSDAFNFFDTVCTGASYVLTSDELIEILNKVKNELKSLIGKDKPSGYGFKFSNEDILYFKRGIQQKINILKQIQ